MAKQKESKSKTKHREIWRTLSGYEPAYQLKISNRGKIAIVPEVKRDPDGRLFVTLAGRDIPVDLMVAQAFIPNPTKSEVPIHLNGDMSDNDADNIRWLKNGKDEDVPQRIFSTLSLLTYILHPNLLADRDKEFTKFYTYLEYLWRSGQLPIEEEQLILDGYDEHRKRTNEAWINETLTKNSAYKEAEKAANSETPNHQDSLNHEPIEVPHPYTYIPKEILASALIDLYDRAMSQQDFQRATVQTNLKTLLPELIHGAIRRVVNQGGPQINLVKSFNIEHPSMWTKSKESGTVYSNIKNNMFEMALWATDTERRLNMVSPLPKLNKGEISRTKHIQSLLYEVLSTCKMPDWAKKEILQDVTPEMLEKFKHLSDELGLEEEHIDIHEEPEHKPTKSDERQEEAVNPPSSASADIAPGSQSVNPPKVKMKFGTSASSSSTSTPSYDDYADAVITSVKPIQKDIENTETADNLITEQPVESKASTVKISFKSTGQIQKDEPLPTFTGHTPVYSPDQPYLKPNQRTYAVGRKETPENIPASKERTKYTGGTVPQDVELDAPYYRYKRDEAGFPIHYVRQRVFTEDEKDLYKLPRDINTTPEFDELGRPLYDDRFDLIIYNDSLSIPVNDIESKARSYVHRTAVYEDKQKQAKKLAEYMTANSVTVHPDHRKDADTSNPDYVSPLYVKERDLTLGYINAYAGREASAFYNRQGYKVYHNVPYGERYDPEMHTLFIPELYEFPDLFNVRNKKRSYITEYAEYLQKRHPEITDPDIFRKYYETAKAAKQITAAVPNTAKDVMWKHGKRGTPVRGWMPDGECMVFDSIKEAANATGCSDKAIKDCCQGRRIDAYGIRWEYVDLCDMDTMINRYIKRVMEACEQTDVEMDWSEYMTDEARARMKEACKSPEEVQRAEIAQNNRDRKEYEEYKDYEDMLKKKRRNLDRGRFSTDMQSINNKEISDDFYANSDKSVKSENYNKAVTGILDEEPDDMVSDLVSDKDEDISVNRDTDNFSDDSEEYEIDSSVIKFDGKKRPSFTARWKDYVPYFERGRQKPDGFIFKEYDQSDKPWLKDQPLYEDTDEWATECVEPVWDESVFDPEVPEDMLIIDETTGQYIRRRKEMKISALEDSVPYQKMNERVENLLSEFMPDSSVNGNESDTGEITDEIEDEILVPEEEREGYKPKRGRGRPRKE